MLNNSNPVTMSGPPHFVDLHVNPGESVSIQMFDGNETILRGPATITMVSQHTFPPIPMPVQVPPGHMVQQIVDENGTLRHIILSALNNNGQSGPAATLVQPQPQPPHQAQPPAQSPFGPYGCCCCCYCSGASPSAAVVHPQASVPPPATVHNGVLTFPGQASSRRRAPSRSNNNSFAYSKRTGVSNNQNSSSPFFNADTITGGHNNGNNKSPNRGKLMSMGHHHLQGSMNHHGSDNPKMIIPSSNNSESPELQQANQHQNNHHSSNPSSELITNSSGSSIVTEHLTAELQKGTMSSSPLQFNCKSFQPKCPSNNKTSGGEEGQLDIFPPPLHNSSSQSVSPTSTVDSSSVGYASDTNKYADDFRCNGSMDTDLHTAPHLLLSNGSCDSRASSSSPVGGGSRCSTELGDQLDTLTGELILNNGLLSSKKRSDSSDVLSSTDTELSTLEVSIDSMNESDSRNGSELNMEVTTMSEAAFRHRLSAEKSLNLVQSSPTLTTKATSQTNANKEQQHNAVGLLDAKAHQLSSSPKKASQGNGSSRKSNMTDQKEQRISHLANVGGNRHGHSGGCESPSKKSPSKNQKTLLDGAKSIDEIDSDKCKRNGLVCDEYVNSAASAAATSVRAMVAATTGSPKRTNISSNELEEKVAKNVDQLQQSVSTSSASSVQRQSERRSTAAALVATRKSDNKKAQQQLQEVIESSRTSSRASSHEGSLSSPLIESLNAEQQKIEEENQVAVSPSVAAKESNISSVAAVKVAPALPPKPSPQRSPKHLLPQVQCLNLTYSTLTASSVKLKWTHAPKEQNSEAGSDNLSLTKESGAVNLFTHQYSVEMVQSKQQSVSTTTSGNGSNSSSGGSGNGSPSATGSSSRLVYQGTLNTCRVAHLSCQQQYSFRVHSLQDERVVFVSNLLTITTPEMPPPTKHKKSKQQQLQQLLAQQQSFQNNHYNHHHQNQAHASQHRQDQNQATKSSAEADPVDIAEKSDQRCAIVLLTLFTLLALVVAVVIQYLLAA